MLLANQWEDVSTHPWETMAVYAVIRVYSQGSALMIVHSKGNIGSGLVVTCCWQGSVGVTNKVGCCCCCVKADVYRAAAEVLAVADSQLPYSSSPALQAARLGLAHDRALHRGDARHSALFASQLLGLADPTDSVSKTLRYCSPSLTCCMCQNLSTHIWSNPTLPHLTAPHLTSPHRTSPHLTLPHPGLLCGLC